MIGKQLQLLCATVFMAGAAIGQTYPDRPIKLLVGFAAGGATDLVARVSGQYMSEKLGQPVVVENRPGASGMIAADAMVKSAPDGYTIAACSTVNNTLPLLNKAARTDPIKDYTLIAQVGIAPYILVASPALKVKTLGEVLQLAKSKKGGLTYASGGQGSTPHLAAKLFESAAGISMMHIPYKGLAEAMPAVMSGQVDLAFDQEASAGASMRAGKLIPIAIASETRSPTLPDVPTFAEAGLPLEATQWIGLCGPQGIPAATVNALSDSAAHALQSADLKERFAQLGVQPKLLPSEEFAKFVQRDRNKWQDLIQKSNLSIE